MIYANPFRCPDCGAVSYNPHDKKHGYCGRCHLFTEDEPRWRFPMANPVMHLNLHGEGCWPDLAGRKVIHKTELSVAGLAGGMASGRTSVTLRVDLDEQTTLLVETSLTLLEEAVAALRAAHGR